MLDGDINQAGIPAGSMILETAEFARIQLGIMSLQPQRSGQLRFLG